MLLQIEHYVPIHHPVAAKQEPIERLDAKADLVAVAIVAKQEVTVRQPGDHFAVDLDVDGRKHGDEHFFDGLVFGEVDAETDGSSLLGLLADVGMGGASVFNLLKEEVVLSIAEVGEGRA